MDRSQKPNSSPDSEEAERWYGRMRELYTTSPMHQYLGLSLDHVADGSVVVGFAMNPQLNNALGMIHGSIQTAAMDSAILQSVRTKCREGDHLVTVELKINFLKAAIGPRFECHANAVRVGGSIGVAEAKIVSPDGQVHAIGLGTISVKRKH